MGTHIVRRCTTDDIDWVLPELSAAADSYGTKIKPFLDDDPEYSERILRHWIEKHVGLVSENQSGLTGMMFGEIAPHAYNPGIIVLTERVWWVPERCRRSRAGLLLLKRFAALGREFADWTVVTTQCKTNVGGGTMCRMGFSHYEHSYILER